MKWTWNEPLQLPAAYCESLKKIVRSEHLQFRVENSMFYLGTANLGQWRNAAPATSATPGAQPLGGAKKAPSFNKKAPLGQEMSPYIVK